jgi:hypothetical protein
MKSIIIALATLLIFFPAYAQPDILPVAKIQKLLDRAEGETYVNIIGSTYKVTKQEITATTYTIYQTLLKKGSKFIDEYTNIQWEKGFVAYSMVPHPEEKNGKLTRCAFKFNVHLTLKGTHSTQTQEYLEFFVLTKDYDEFESLIKKVREKVPR